MADGVEQERGFESSFKAYYEALHLAYLHILKEKPDIIVVPLRGAEPLIKGIKLIATLERKSSLMPRVCYVNVGEIDRGKSPYPYSHDAQYKQQEIKSKLQMAIDGWKKATKSDNVQPKIMLIDEASKGGAISSNFHATERAMKKLKIRKTLTAIAITEAGKDRFATFDKLVSQGKIKPIMVKKLFTMDRQDLLWRLIRLSRTKTIAARGNIIRKLDLQKNLMAEHLRRKPK